MDSNTPFPSGQPKASLPHDGESVLHDCPAAEVLRLLSGKWKPQILQLASQDKIRFNGLLRKIPGSNKQSLSVALKDLEEANVLQKHTISVKPLHVEYTLTDRGLAMLTVFRAAAGVAKDNG